MKCFPLPLNKAIFPKIVVPKQRAWESLLLSWNISCFLRDQFPVQLELPKLILMHQRVSGAHFPGSDEDVSVFVYVITYFCELPCWRLFFCYFCAALFFFTLLTVEFPEYRIDTSDLFFTALPIYSLSRAKICFEGGRSNSWCKCGFESLAWQATLCSKIETAKFFIYTPDEFLFEDLWS